MKYNLWDINDFRDVLRDLMKPSTPELESRNGKCKELIDVSVHNTHPGCTFRSIAKKEYFLSKLYESAWVVAGRNDLGGLGLFLPRAYNYSDDNYTWRGAYGPRLYIKGPTNISQLDNVINILAKDPNSRQAVISIYDPHQDCGVKTKDLPCNNFLQFLIRNNALHLIGYQRSCDAMWGFLGINHYEWAYLMYVVRNALWRKGLNHIQIGSHTHHFGSLHVYEPHYGKCDSILMARDLYYPKSYGWQLLDTTLHDLFSSNADDPDISTKLCKIMEDCFHLNDPNDIHSAITLKGNIFRTVLKAGFTLWCAHKTQPYSYQLAEHLSLN